MKLALAAAAALTLAATAAHAAPKVSAAWSRPAAQGSTGAGYMTLSNAGPADALVAVESPLSGHVMIHQSAVANGMASMKMVDRVPVATGRSVTFAPGGYHLMFMGLTRALGVGDTLPATLVFASGARVKASFVVGLAPPVAAPAR
ncbi:MAG: copper chaperone PCu(A)C [Phenylobacterium sp.]|nr:copper chaperone PCu(A)C [Phenylobacterium sp.]